MSVAEYASTARCLLRIVTQKAGLGPRHARPTFKDNARSVHRTQRSPAEYDHCISHEVEIEADMTDATRRQEETTLIIRAVRLTRALGNAFGIDPPDELVARIIHTADDIRPLGPQKWSHTAPPEWDISQAVAALPPPNNDRIDSFYDFHGLPRRVSVREPVRLYVEADGTLRLLSGLYSCDVP